MDGFGEIRSLLHHPATSAQVHAMVYRNWETVPADPVKEWTTLLELLQQASRRPEWKDTQHEVMPYVHQVLDEQWPDEARVAPAKWVTEMVRLGKFHSLASVAKAVDIRRRSNPYLVKMFASPHLEWVRHITIGGRNFKTNSVKALINSHALRHLTSLTFFEASLGSTRLRILRRAPWFKNLKSLRFVSCELNDKDLNVLFKGLEMPNLEYLDLQDNGYLNMYSDQCLNELVQCKFPKLREFNISGWSLLWQKGRDPSIWRPGDLTKFWKSAPLELFNSTFLTTLFGAPWVKNLEKLEVTPSSREPLNIKTREHQAVYNENLEHHRQQVKASQLKEQLKAQVLKSLPSPL